LRRKAIGALSIVLLIGSLGFALNIKHAEAAEPSLSDILTFFGFTNTALSSVETFPAGDYNVTVYAAFAGWWSMNNLSWYSVGSTVYNDIFLGSEGSGFGYLNPYVNKSFRATEEFGLSFISPANRYFTNHTANPDGLSHAMIYTNLDSSRPMYLIGFENGGGDFDYQDMVISLTQLTHDVAITLVTALPTSPVMGDSVTVTVTAANLGDLPEDFDVAAFYDNAPIGTTHVSGLQPGANTVLPFLWDTTGGPLGTFVTGAIASFVLFETNVLNNVYFDGSVTVVNHDVAITDVTASPSKVLKGDPVTVTVNATNLGSVPESFSVNAYYDGALIGTEPVNNLLPGTFTILTFNWNTAGVALGTYTIKANATLPLDTDTSNNQKTDGTVKIMQKPVASFTYNPVPAIENATTTFTSTSTSTGGPIINYTWNFGDGNTTWTTATSIKHVYALFGTYTVTLTVEDSDHLTNSTSQSVLVLRHDVAVTDVTPYRSWIYEGRSVDINVTIANFGNFTEPTVDVDLYYNFTALQKIGTLSIGPLDPDETVTLTFTWDTTGVPHCHNYTITAVARIAAFDSNTTNNMLDGQQKVKVRIMGDVDGDGSVDMTDVNAFIDAFLTYPGHPHWNPDVDLYPLLTGDDSIDMMDLSIIIDHYMESCSS